MLRIFVPEITRGPTQTTRALHVTQSAMLPVRAGEMGNRLAITALFIFAGTASGNPSPSTDDVHTIIQRSVAANKADNQAAPFYDFSEREKDRRGGTKTFREIMIDGSRYEELIAVNNEPLSGAQKSDENDKLQQEREQRRVETPRERSARVARYQKAQRRNRLMMDELVKAFDFTLTGEDQINGHQVYVLTAKPRPGYNPPNMEAQVLTGMEGKLWIDKASYHWVKVEAEVIRPVSIEGFLARVEPGTRFELEKEPVSDSIWEPSHFAMRSRAKILMVFAHNGQADETYFDYAKNGASVSTTGH